MNVYIYIGPHQHSEAYAYMSTFGHSLRDQNYTVHVCAQSREWGARTVATCTATPKIYWDRVGNLRSVMDSVGHGRYISFGAWVGLTMSQFVPWNSALFKHPSHVLRGVEKPEDDANCSPVIFKFCGRSGANFSSGLIWLVTALQPQRACATRSGYREERSR